MKRTNIALFAAAALMSLALNQAHAVVIATAANQQAEQEEDDASRSTHGIIFVAPDRQIGIVTCGKRSGEGAGSLGCTDYSTSDNRVIPYKEWPGYRLADKVPASYVVTAIQYDQYKGVTTIYFQY